MIYVHVPFCRSFCTYCAFYSRTECSSGNYRKYLESLRAEISARSGDILSTRDYDTLYIGGGTPSVLPSCLLREVVGSLPGGRVTDEFTVEVNPDDIAAKGESYLRELADMGVNRISMGVQSLDDGVLRWMNRRHDAASARRAFALLRDGGFDNVSIDLISGYEGFSPASVEEVAAVWHPEHISAYQLGIEEGSALEEMAASGRWSEAGEEECAAQYGEVCRILSENGYRHYEISNWALPGREARHNSAYWTRRPYVGLGPAAHSLCGERVRSWNSDALFKWKSSSETLDDIQIREEKVMLGLRTSEGVEVSLCRQEELERMLAEGFLEKTNPGRVRIPEHHWFVADSLIASLA